MLYWNANMIFNFRIFYKQNTYFEKNEIIIIKINKFIINNNFHRVLDL